MLSLDRKISDEREVPVAFFFHAAPGMTRKLLLRKFFSLLLHFFPKLFVQLSRFCDCFGGCCETVWLKLKQQTEESQEETLRSRAAVKRVTVSVCVCECENQKKGKARVEGKKFKEPFGRNGTRYQPDNFFRGFSSSKNKTKMPQTQSDVRNQPTREVLLQNYLLRSSVCVSSNETENSWESENIERMRED